jgi:hypothetical protein
LYKNINFQIHEKYREKSVPCDYCEAKFYNRKDYRTHKDKYHLKKSEVCCEFCGKSFATRVLWKVHINSKHTGERLFHCSFPDCKKSYFSNGDLTKHVKYTHSTEPVPKRITKKYVKFYYCLEYNFYNRLPWYAGQRTINWCHGSLFVTLFVSCL